MQAGVSHVWQTKCFGGPFASVYASRCVEYCLPATLIRPYPCLSQSPPTASNLRTGWDAPCFRGVQAMSFACSSPILVIGWWNALKGGQGLASHCLLSSGERPHLESSMRASLSAHQSTPGPWCRGGVWLLGRLRYAAIPCVCGVFFVAETSVTCAHGCPAMFAGHRVPSVIAHRPRHACRVLDKHSLAATHRAVFKFNCHVLHPLA